MRNLTLIFAFIISISLLSCSDDDQSSDFEGHWTGIYSGSSDSGVFDINISESGIATGTVTSNIFFQTFSVIGEVKNNGSFDATAGAASSGATFTGTFSGTTGSGTWNNSGAGINGTWNGNKQ